MRARHGARMMICSFRKTLFCALSALLLVQTPGLAQSNRASEEAPPYEQGLLRLVTIIGSLEFLHPLCDRQNKGVWKSQMANLLEAEEPSPARRARMMASYNKAYEVLEQVHRSCTPNVKLILERYETEAVELTRVMATTYRPIAPQPKEEAAVEDATAGEAEATPEQ